MNRRLIFRREQWKVAEPFVIARGSKTIAETIVVEIKSGALSGRGEAVPYPRYGESVEGSLAAVEAMENAVAAGLDRHGLQRQMPPGAARNALDAALWDLEAKETDTSVWELAGIEEPHPLTTAFTLSLDTPERMAAAAAENAERPLLKLKLGGAGDVERVQAVRHAVPHARIIVDANESWTEDQLAEFAPVLGELGVLLIEQPLPEGRDGALALLPHPVPICADESCHASDGVAALVGRYDFVNVKLDKTGGLTEALLVCEAARAHGIGIMVGCMVAGSLAMAPALVLAQRATFVDLDGPLLLARDRQPGLRYDGSTVYPPKPNLWG
ncbi:MAG: dipeptide epimerase [Rhodospirillales bacterium]|nr:dipeptide epimerase [Rhodospirillales bacterium]